MAYIRDKKEELTGFEVGSVCEKAIDVGVDFVMVFQESFPTEDAMNNALASYREKEYVANVMAGITWGSFLDYLEGKWDGETHWDEVQRDRNETSVEHNPSTPYMATSTALADYIADRLKRAVDSGVEAFYMVEPEFWDGSGYSEGFKREYEIYYREPWAPLHESADVRYKASKLKRYIFVRALDRVGTELKAYGKKKYNKEIRIYVPTHSLLNYTQWKIVSPEAALIDIPAVDGYIAQIWTGTSRTGNVYQGVYKERTFETAYLEYGVMQELVRGTGRKMWFLNDPIEDCAWHTWDDFRYNYEKTAAASLMHPHIWNYEVCPWPHRIFNGKYPKKQTDPVNNTWWTVVEDENSKPIPPEYATFLSGMFQLFGDMEQPDISCDNVDGIGIFMSDSGMFQRTFPDSVFTDRLGKRLRNVLISDLTPEIDEEESTRLMKEIGENGSLMFDFIQSEAFPSFYGLALPLVKYGLPVRPIQLDNVRRFAGYLKDIRFAVLSYEFMKPDGPDINAALISWVMSGGTLCYVGDGSDPYHKIDEWWTKSGYDTPAQHLFEMAGIGRDPEDGIYAVGSGRIALWNMHPARISLTAQAADKLRETVRQALKDTGIDWKYRNDLTVQRGPYIISAVMNESVNEDKKVFEGLFADLKTSDYALIERKEIGPDENALLFDLSKIDGEVFRIVGTSSRIADAKLYEDSAVFLCKTGDNIRAFTRVRLPKEVCAVSGVDEEGNTVPMEFKWDERTRTLLFSYLSRALEVTVTAEYRS